VLQKLRKNHGHPQSIGEVSNVNIKPMMLFFLVDFLQNPYIILIEEIIELHVKI
jgi:hypothetical protein